MSFLSYGGPCIGRVMAFLYEYAPRSNSWQLGGGEIFVGRKKIGTYTFKGMTDIPEFDFTDPEYQYLNQVHADKWFEHAKYLEGFKKTPVPFFDTDYRDGNKYTNLTSVQSYRGKAWAEVFADIYRGDPNKITPQDYDAIAADIDREAYAFLSSPLETSTSH